jgi:hypothetical protein
LVRLVSRSEDQSVRSDGMAGGTFRCGGSPVPYAQLQAQALQLIRRVYRVLLLVGKLCTHTRDHAAYERTNPMSRVLSAPNLHAALTDHIFPRTGTDPLWRTCAAHSRIGGRPDSSSPAFKRFSRPGLGPNPQSCNQMRNREVQTAVSMDAAFAFDASRKVLSGSCRRTNPSERLLPSSRTLGLQKAQPKRNPFGVSKQVTL